MAELKSSNPYDHLLVRTEEPENVKIQLAQVKTHEIFEEGNCRVRVFTANPQPHRFYVGCEICIPDIDVKVYSPVTDCAKIGFATTEQNAMLFMLGRIVANYGDKINEHIAHFLKQAIFNHRQRTLF